MMVRFDITDHVYVSLKDLEDIYENFHNKSKVEAIKALRKIKPNLSLSGAKQIVDEYFDHRITS